MRNRTKVSICVYATVYLVLYYTSLIAYTIHVHILSQAYKCAVYTSHVRIPIVPKPPLFTPIPACVYSKYSSWLIKKHNIY